MTTHYKDDNDQWHTFEEKPITSMVPFNGSDVKIIEEHNPNKWVITAYLYNQDKTLLTTCTAYIQKDLPFLIFEIIKSGPMHGTTTKTYRHVPNKYLPVYDIMQKMISQRKIQDKNFVCGVIS